MPGGYLLTIKKNIMNPFKNALIIENEYDVDHTIKAFLNDNPDLFDKVVEQTFALNRKVEDLFRFVVEADSIIIATTYMYADQVTDYIKAFLAAPGDKRYNFFVHRSASTFNNWKDKTYLSDKMELREHVIALLDAGHPVYEFGETPDYDAQYISDDFCGIHTRRRPYTYHEMKYDQQSDLFYLPEHPFYNLKEMQDDHK